MGNGLSRATRSTRYAIWFEKTRSQTTETIRETGGGPGIPVLLVAIGVVVVGGAAWLAFDGLRMR